MVSEILTKVLGGVLTHFGTQYLDSRRLQAIPRKRQEALSGRWAGQIDQPEHPLGPIKNQVTATFSAKGKRISGSLHVKPEVLSGPSKRSKIPPLELVATGGFYHETFLKFEYHNRDESVLQFGTMILCLNATGTTLKGRFVGYGSIAEAVVTGTVVFDKTP